MSSTRTESKRWTIKIGSGVLLDDDGAVDHACVARLVEQITWLRETGVIVTLVSSGAVALGRVALGDRSDDRSLPRLQALAATGQAKLIQMYDEAFSPIPVAQILLTRSDLNDRRRHMNARLTLEELHRSDVVPIINENDTVATDELRFGDNDQLAAMTAYLVNADLLVVLSVASGFCEIDAQGQLGAVMPTVECFDPALDAMVLASTSTVGKGGMRTKLDAARFAYTCGIPTVVAPGKSPDVIRHLRAGELVGTYFGTPSERAIPFQKKSKSWISFNTQIEGTLICDRGAKDAIVSRGASLLPSGVKRVDGQFTDGALVSLADESGNLFARGVAVYPSDAIEKLIGAQSSEIEARLGYKILNNVVHRDGLVLESTQK